MNLSTLSLMLLVTVCCSILVEVTSGLENDDAEKNVDFLRDNKAIREYIKNADNKAKAVEDIREKLLAAGMKARARRFMKRARTRFEKRRENRKEHHGRKDLPRRHGSTTEAMVAAGEATVEADTRLSLTCTGTSWLGTEPNTAIMSVIPIATYIEVLPPFSPK
ncbi:hypothetical protein Bbelb_277630 [Branchiostoma belcheri]|nr:hypothetical protein Bbelb_277630 [Branchiostoma belcheri]